MNTPTRQEGTPASIRRSRRLINRTKAITAIATHVAEFEAAVTSLETGYNEWTQARHQVVIAISAQHEAEAALDQELRGVGLAILNSSRGRRTSEIYRKYFPDGYGSALNLTASQSLAVAAGLIEAMTDETIPVIQACKAPLEAARAPLETATAQRQAAEDARSRARANLEEQKLAWRKSYNWFYYMVRSVFSDRRSYVESLFQMTGRPASQADPPPEPKTDQQADKLADPPLNRPKTDQTKSEQSKTVAVGAAVDGGGGAAVQLATTMNAVPVPVPIRATAAPDIRPTADANTHSTADAAALEAAADAVKTGTTP